MSLPTDGPWPPTLEVVKNTGSIRSKSRSSSIRCMSTEPTIPRQPIRPTRFIATTPSTKSGPLHFCSGPNTLQIPQRGDYCIAHFLSTNLGTTFAPDVSGAQALVQHQAHGLFDGVSCGLLAEAVTQHHRYRKNGRQRVGDALAGDVRGRTVARLVHALVVHVQR